MKIKRVVPVNGTQSIIGARRGGGQCTRSPPPTAGKKFTIWVAFYYFFLLMAGHFLQVGAFLLLMGGLFATFSLCGGLFVPAPPPPTKISADAHIRSIYVECIYTMQIRQYVNYPPYCILLFEGSKKRFS